jgi:uncharacterized protein YrrD
MTREAVNERTSRNPLVESHRIEGTRVHDGTRRCIGTVRHLVIEKNSGRVVYVVISFGGLFRKGSHLRPIPWEKLTYDSVLRGYRTDITEQEVEGAPTAHEKLWCDQRREMAIRDYWDVPPFRGV